MAARFDTGSMESYGAVQAAGADVTVPNAALLFTGDFSRAGTDLVISGSDGAKFVVTDYFQTDTPPSLLSPQGAMLTGDVVTSLAGPQFPGMYAQAGGGAASAAKEIGKVQTLDGSGSVVRANGVTETLKVGDPVFEGDVVMTGPASKMGIGFVDGTVFSMSASARMVLNKLVFNPDGADNSMLFSLVEGSFVFAAGQIAPTGDMKIQTPVATMGIRGTAPTVDINSQNGTVNFSIVPDPGDGHIGNYTLYNLETGAVIGSISDAGSYWVLTGADGSITQIEKTQDDLLKDAESISQINSVYNTYQNNTQNPQAGPENNPPNSSGLNTNQNNNESVDGNTNNNEGGNQNQNNEGENNTPPATNTPPPFTDTNDPPPPLEDPTEGAGINVINGTPGDDNPLRGTDGDDFISGFGGNDVIYDHGGDDFVEAGDGDDIIVAGAGDDDYDGGEGTDGVNYSDTDQSVVINIVTGEVNSEKFGFDTIANLERFVTGSGEDTFIFGADTGWFFDGGLGVDTLLISGDLDVDTRTALSDAENIEVIDLNDDPGNVFTIQADDFQSSGPSDAPNNTLTFLGGDGDILVLGDDLTIDETTVPGTWVLAEGSEDDLEIYNFVDGNDDIRATALVEPDITVISETGLGDQSRQLGQQFSLSITSIFTHIDPEEGLLEYSFSYRDDYGILHEGLPPWLQFVGGELKANPIIPGEDTFADLRLTIEHGDTSFFRDFHVRIGDIGTDGPDTMEGHTEYVWVWIFKVPVTDFDDVVAGLNGDDTIHGLGGNDYLFGDGGNDEIFGGAGRDVIYGGEGDDDLFGNSGNDIIHGGNGNDEIVGGAGNDVIFGGDGDDNKIIGDHVVNLLGLGDDGDDILHGGNGNDYIIGDSETNFLNIFDFGGHGGNDFIDGGDGNDTIIGDYELDAGNFNGTGGDDVINGGNGNDTIYGDNAGSFFGGQGGNDTITGGLGIDTMTGGGGENTYVYNSVDEGGDFITDFTGLDAFDLTEFLADAIANILPPGDELSSIIDQFVQAITDGDGNTTVAVDANGAEGGQEYTTLATLGAHQGFDPSTTGITVIIDQHEADVMSVV